MCERMWEDRREEGRSGYSTKNKNPHVNVGNNPAHLWPMTSPALLLSWHDLDNEKAASVACDKVNKCKISSKKRE